MAETDPRLRAALANARRETSEAVSSLQTMATELRKEHRQFEKERAGREEARARQAREGELGPEMQRLQQRVDLRQTTWDDVLEGRDDHPSAVAARVNVQRHLREAGEAARLDPEFVEADLETRAAQERVRTELEG